MFWRMLFMYFFIIKKYNDSTTKAKYLGFAFYYQFQEKKYRMKVPKKSLDKVMKKVRELTSRKWSVSNSYKAKKIAEVVRGWINYFKIGSILTVTRKLDTMLRYRFRMCIWKQANHCLKITNKTGITEVLPVLRSSKAHRMLHWLTEPVRSPYGQPDPARQQQTERW